MTGVDLLSFWTMNTMRFTSRCYPLPKWQNRRKVSSSSSSLATSLSFEWMDRAPLEGRVFVSSLGTTAHTITLHRSVGLKNNDLWVASSLVRYAAHLA